MMVALSFLLALLGFALLALSLAKHYRDLVGGPLPVLRGRVFRVAGWLLLGASMMGAMAEQGFGIGIVLWVALLTVAALIVGLAISYRDTWRRA
jgi:hypothetical protein